MDPVENTEKERMSGKMVSCQLVTSCLFCHMCENPCLENMTSVDTRNKYRIYLFPKQISL